MLEAVNNIIKYIVTMLFVTTPNFVTPIVPDKNIFVETYPQVVIENTWIAYKDRYIQDDGRTVDPDREFITTSEGQSYSLLRSVYMDDKETFDKVLNWTNNNLRVREEDKLFAWKWGQNSEGEWTVLTDDGGINTATDADQDIAIALIFANKRWNEKRYLDQALEVLNDIWAVEVMEINEKPYLLAGNWAKEEEFPTVNPSYYTFSYYPVFAQVNSQNDWLALRETSYEILNATSSKVLDGPDNEVSVGLPPDWAALNPETAEVIAPDDQNTNFSDDAFRIPWRVGLDYMWHQNPKAKNYLQSLNFLSQEWENENKIYATYTQSGIPTVDYQSHSMYGATLAYFVEQDPDAARRIYLEKLANLYDQDFSELDNEQLGYYSQNWVWFGMLYYNNKIPNLYEQINLIGANNGN